LKVAEWERGSFKRRRWHRRPQEKKKKKITTTLRDRGRERKRETNTLN